MRSLAFSPLRDDTTLLGAPRVARRRALRAGLLALLATGCSEETLSPVPIDLEVGGGFDATIEGGNRLVVKAADGRVLLDGLPPGAVADEEPPLVGFATRDVTTTYEMQYGAFKPTIVGNGPWQVARTLGRDGRTLALRDASGADLATITLETPEEGHLVAALTLPGGALPDPATPERRTKLSWGFACDAEDHFAGFGAQTWDVDHRGQSVPTFVSEEGIGKSQTDDYTGLWMLQGQRHSSQAPLPEVLSRRGFILAADTDRRAVFALCSERDTAARIEVDLPATIHLFDGPSPAAAIERATATFGRPRMPPAVAFAPWLDAVFGSENVRAVATKLRDEAIPVSVIWTEDWRGGEWSKDNYALKEEWEVDRTLYPDIETLADDLHALGFDFHVYFNPFVYVGSKAWDETAEQGLLVKKPSGEPYLFTGAKFTDTGLIDLDNPDARAWAKGKMQAAIALGADGWMNDFAEWLPTDGVTAAGPSYESHNRWPVLWQEVAREAIDDAPAGESPRLFFSRSAWFGTPALADVFWAGDQRTTFDVDDGLPTIVPIGVGLGLVGISTYGHDIAGYQSANNPGSTKELFFRWTELGAWSPVMRTHHGAQPNKEWAWDKDADTIDHFRRYARLHMALVPTVRGLAQEASDSGLPIWRGLAIHFPEDATVWPITDEVMLGEHVLIAPIVTAGATRRSVYLPTGRWVPWSGGTAIDGPVAIDVDAPVGEIPVFVRAGALVPMYPDGVLTLVRGSSDIPDPSILGEGRVLRAVLGASGAFEEADGARYALTAESADASGALAATFTTETGEAVMLTACDAQRTAPCFDADTLVAELPGAGSLTLVGPSGLVATLSIEGALDQVRVELAR